MGEWNKLEIMTLSPLLSLFILFMLMILMIILYLKMRVFLIVLVLFLFSLVIGMSSIQEGAIPFSPYIQIFFLLFQTTIFFIVSMGVFYDKT